MQSPAIEWFQRLWLKPVVPQTDATNVIKRVEEIWTMVQLSPGCTVLDVACGTGSEAIELAARGIRVTGLDLSPDMLVIAKKCAHERGIDVEWICADMRTIDWNEKFDVVMLRDVIFGIFDHDANRDLLSRLAKAIKPGGRLLLEVYNKSVAMRHGIEHTLHHNPSTGRFEGKVKLDNPVNGDDYLDASCELLTITEWRAALADVGLQDFCVFPANGRHDLEDSLILYITSCSKYLP